MTQEEKLKIIKLSQEGNGYKKIAAELKLSIGSIRNVLKDGCCPNCGKKLTFVVGKKKKKFCCDNCRYEYWNKVRKVAK